jgi:hypothetical protein
MDLSRIKRAVSNLTDEDFEKFWDWFEDYAYERDRERTQNDPVERQYLELGNMIMSQPDPGRFLADLFSRTSDEGSASEEEGNKGMQTDARRDDASDP